MSRTAFMRAVQSMPSFRNLMHAYVHAFFEEVLVSGACNGAHSLKERLARWLLMMRDRTDEAVLQITHSLLAEMLGVQRPTITNAVRELERADLIAPGRRQLTIGSRGARVPKSSPDVTFPASICFFKFSRSTQASAIPCSIAVFTSGENVVALKVFPAPTPILAKRAISSVSEGSVGVNCRMKFRMLKNSSDFLSSSVVSGLMKSTARAAFGAD
jgi:Crp-like helix-turn-helix domain